MRYLICLSLGAALAAAQTVGTPTFQTSTIAACPTGFVVEEVVTGDFNGDGHPDVAVSCEEGVSSPADPTASMWQIGVLLGDGKGNFQSPVFTPLASDLVDLSTSLLYLVAADFNADRRTDLAITPQTTNDYATNRPMYVACVLLSAGDGSFTPLSPVNTNSYSLWGAGDFDGKGIFGLALGASAGGPVLGIMDGEGNGALSALSTFAAPSGDYIEFGTLADVNGDGKTDLVLINSAIKNSAPVAISILLSQGGGSFSAPSTLVPVTAEIYEDVYVVSGDFNGDGNLDLGVEVDGQKFMVYFGNGAGAFQAAQQGPAIRAEPLFTLDVNGDGQTDFVEASGSGLLFYVSNGDGTFQALNVPTTAIELDQSQEASAADFNGDGKGDLVGISPERNMVAILINTTVTPPPAPAVTSVSNAFGGATVIAPNTWVAVKGTNLAPAGDARTWQDSDFVQNQMPVSLDGVSVTMNGENAFIFYISGTQINALTPPDLAPGPVQVVVTANGTGSKAFTAQAQALSPSFFVFDGTHVVGTHLTGGDVGPATLYPGLTTPAQPQEEVVLYANGFGPTSVPVVAGSSVQSGSLPSLPVVTIGGAQANVIFAGLVSPGLYQFNVIVPSTAANGDLPLVATFGGLATQSGVVITVQE